MRMTVFSARAYDRRFLEGARAKRPALALLDIAYHEAALAQETVSLAEGADAICVFVNDDLGARVLEALRGQGVRAILLRCAGFNMLDLEAADRLGLFVARVPAYSPETVAEHAIALVMTLNRNIHRAYNRVREGNFQLDGLIGRTLHGRTVGIVGTGRIGLATARILKGFGCRVLGADPQASPDFSAIGEHVDLETLLAAADIVSLHCPLTEATRHMIDETTLALMRPDAMLVNTSRGGLVDTSAVIAALKSRRLGALAIDVYEQESALFFRDRSGDIIGDDVFQRLMTFPNVLVTGHQGFFTTEALTEISDITLSSFEAFLEGRDCPNRIALCPPFVDRLCLDNLTS